MQPLEARRSQAGSFVRCPWCLSRQEVPQQSRRPPKLEPYPIRPDDAPPEDQDSDWQRYVPVICRLCRTRMYATPQQAGQKLICPDCGTATTVQEVGSEKAAPGATPARTKPDIYGIWEGTDQPPPSARSVYGRYVAVICNVCGTRLLATEDQVGQQMVCPDCGASHRVPPPAEMPDLDLPDPSKAGQYGLLGEGEPGPEGATEHFRYYCPRCSTGLSATFQDVGQEVTCPDCRSMFRVPRPPPKAARICPAEEVEPYQAAEGPVPRPPVYVRGFAPVVDDRPLEPVTDEKQPESLLLRRSVPQLPRSAFLIGVFDFPFYRDSWPRWVGLGLGGVVCSVLGGIGARLIAQASYFDVAGWLYALVGTLLAAATVCLGLLVLARLANACLTIVVDTASAIDAIDDWHEGEWVDRIGDVLYLVGSIAWAAVLGLLLDYALRACGLSRGVGMAAGVFFLQPIVLLSMLEADTPLTPVSLSVWQTLATAWQGWLAFYALAALDLALLLVANIGLGYLGGLLRLLILPFLIVAWLMIYFRLLGRLGLYCAWKTARQSRQPPVG